MVSRWSHGVDDPYAVLVAAHTDLDEPCGAVRSEEQHDVIVLVCDMCPVAQRMANVGVGDAVLAGTRTDRRLGELPLRQG